MTEFLGTRTGVADIDAVACDTVLLVSAGRIVCDRVVRTPGTRVAGIVSAYVHVITSQLFAGCARTVLAGITDGASIEVTAGYVVEIMGAAGFRVTSVIRAEVLIHAIYGDAAAANAVCTEFVGGARVEVIADGIIINVYTALQDVTEIIGARILVIALQDRTRRTDRSGALVARGTGVAVIAEVIVRHELASGHRIAGVIGAGIAIFTGQLPGTDTTAQMTVVPNGAYIVIITRGFVQIVEATNFRVATVGGAWIVVLAIGQRLVAALALATMVAEGA